ncbi:hypothetical protein DU505_06415 [Billgrantia montanilacus]|uniref:Uncharacterized protein n=1 Tax=Billgrantia montanilacus TaxID=2282305 RepID=A0A368U0E4_9GAMM|nr:hypothetical protein DU505_06415 [Halomonas montanilacus]
MYEKSASDGQARQKSAKKGPGSRSSLRGVNEHVEPLFNAAWPSAGSFRTKPNDAMSVRHCQDGEWRPTSASTASAAC